MKKKFFIIVLFFLVSLLLNVITIIKPNKLMAEFNNVGCYTCSIDNRCITATSGGKKYCQCGSNGDCFTSGPSCQ